MREEVVTDLHIVVRSSLTARVDRAYPDCYRAERIYYTMLVSVIQPALVIKISR